MQPCCARRPAGLITADDTSAQASCVPHQVFRAPPPPPMATMSARHIFILVLMVYVCVLNILLVNSLFKNYVYAQTAHVTQAVAPWGVRHGGQHDSQYESHHDSEHHSQYNPFVQNSQPTTSQAHKPRQSGQATPPDLDSELCARSQHVVHLALVPGAPSLATHNDLEAHRTVRVLSEVRHALRHGPPVAAYVMLFPSVYTFVGSHRAWCEALHAQTLGRAECELALLPAEATHAAVFEHALKSQPCMHHLVLLHDAARLTVNFFAHLRRARDNEVVCLAQRLSGARSCPVAAFRLPRVFVAAFATQFANTSIEDAAAVMRMDGGDTPAVRVA